ncbi:MAG: hypothetical protein AAGE94_12365 [Acidobacteriota bacterium]
MRLVPYYTLAGTEARLHDRPQPLDLDALLPDDGPWEVEIGYGKGRYLLAQALAHPERRFLGIEVVSKYHKMLTRRMRHWGAENLLNIRGEALYILSTLLPRSFADKVHVYFPDPWPKAKHHRRRLFDPETVDLVIGLLKPGGQLVFASDFLEYGELVMEIVDGYPGLTVEPILSPWPDGARTNYEAKFIDEGRPILRFVAYLAPDAEPGVPHPAGERGLIAAWHHAPDQTDAGSEA